MMDSPIFGNKKNKQTSKPKKGEQLIQNYSDFSEWGGISKNNKNFSTLQINAQLKTTYTVLMLQKHLKRLVSKVNKCMMKKKIQAFQKICLQKNSLAKYDRKNNQQIQKRFNESCCNPQLKPYALLCLNKVYEKLDNMCKAIDRLKLKKMMTVWSRFYVQSQKYNLPTDSAALNSYTESDLGLCSKIQSKKHLNSKKHSKQMKQNSFLNHAGTQIELENEKLTQQILSEQYHRQKFEEKLLNLLSHYESKLIDSDREMWLSQNGVSHSSFENKTGPGKKGNKKK